ncbi:CCNB1IP1 [Symbiodinium necroappetens]|uniref:CCNB1IP1 protein n=1 Tax=Symbiodinium necroappetens TaxID=1628268 RepID=A0A812VNB5_9DINO|nr:CCNB1IP1 [Symbiodinium necroappetens]
MELPCSQRSDLSAEAKHAEHPSLLFRCNHQEKDGKPCEQPLDKGWVTACSHLFCNEHAHRWFASHDSCPVCRTNPVKLVRMDLSRASLRRRGKSCLVGMSPPEVLRALEVSLSFWTDQQLLRFQQEGQHRAQEVGRLACIERTGKARLMEAEDLCNELEKKNDCMENKLAETLREVSELNDELSRISETAHQAVGHSFQKAAPGQALGVARHGFALGRVDCLTFEDFLYNATHGIAAANSRPVNTLITANLTTKDDAYNPFNPFHALPAFGKQVKNAFKCPFATCTQDVVTEDGDDAVDDSDYRIPAFLIMLMIFLAALIYITDCRMKEMCARREEESQEEEEEDEDEEFELVKP